MQANYDLSIVIPIYNKGPYLSKCLDSILKWGYKIQIICVDDCSTDNSVEILEKYRDKYDSITIVKHSVNQGPHQGRKDGVDLALAPKMLIVDADDEIDNEFFEHFNEIMNNYSEYDIVHFESKIDAEDDVSYKMIEQIRTFTKPCYKTLKDKEVFDSFYLDHLYNWHLWDKLYSTDVCKKAFDAIGNDIIFVGEDFVEVAFIAFYAKSYTFSNYLLYNYHYGRGLYGHRRRVTVESFKRTCTSVKLYLHLKSLFDIENSEIQYYNELKKYPSNRLDQCLKQWNMISDADDKKKCSQLLLDCWRDTEFADKIKKQVNFELLCLERTNIQWRRIGHKNPMLYEDNLIEQKDSVVIPANNNNYKETAVTLKTIVNLKAPERYQIVVIHNNLKIHIQMVLSTICSEIKFINVADLTYSCNDSEKELSIVTPFILSDIGCKKIIVIKPGLIIEKTLSPLFELNCNMVLGAVKVSLPNQSLKEAIKKIGLEDIDYVDTSVMLFDLDLFKKNTFSCNTMIKMAGTKKLDEVMNITFRDNISYLSPIYNCQCSFFSKTSNIDKYPAEYSTLVEEAAIINCGDYTAITDYSNPLWIKHHLIETSIGIDAVDKKKQTNTTKLQDNKYYRIKIRSLGLSGICYYLCETIKHCLHIGKTIGN